MISINRVTFNYRKNSKSILNNINLEIKDKEIFGILGPSGAGKTTSAICIFALRDWRSAGRGGLWSERDLRRLRSLLFHGTDPGLLYADRNGHRRA